MQIRVSYRGRHSLFGASWFSFSWNSPDGVVADLDDLVEDQRDIFNSHFKAVLSPHWFLNRMDVQTWDGLLSVGMPSIAFTVPTVQGEALGTDLPSRLTMLCNFKAYDINLNRKRCYVGAYTDVSNEDGVPSAVLTNAASGWISDMLTTKEYGGHTFEPVVMRVDGEGILQGYRSLTSGFPSPGWAQLSSRKGNKGI